MNNELKFDHVRFAAGEMPTRTRNGKQVLHVHDSGLDVEYPVAAWFVGGDLPTGYTKDGLVLAGGGETPFDLVHEPKMRKLRIAVCRDTLGDRRTITVTSDSKGDYFDVFLTDVRESGRLLHLFEVDVLA